MPLTLGTQVSEHGINDAVFVSVRSGSHVRFVLRIKWTVIFSIRVGEVKLHVAHLCDESHFTNLRISRGPSQKNQA